MQKPRNHYELLFNMLDIRENLNRAEALIELARESAGNDSYQQLLCDRKQQDLEETRAMIDQMFIEVPQNN